MTTLATQELTYAWETLQSLIPLQAIHTEQQYNRALNALHELVDVVGDDETHPLYAVLDTLGVLVHTYEEQQYPPAQVSGLEGWRFLMEEHDLTVADLPELGNSQQVAELLRSQRPLSPAQITILAQKFGLSPATFAE